MLNIFIITLSLLNVCIYSKQDDDPSNPMHFKLPWELPDQNQDGFADN